uniref:CD209 antigen-like n=1 Tax=Seriola dumerili TaxID=41447 RepID=A0A3B4TW07_SERDU
MSTFPNEDHFANESKFRLDFQKRKQPCRCATVCLWLLCAVLLAGNIAQIIYYWLQTNYSSLLADRDQLQDRAERLKVKLRGVPCKLGWKKFDISCYFISTMKRNWTESRKSCKAQGTDLVVIESREEQVFVNGVLKKGQNAWIGLTDKQKEGNWMWVDGTPLITKFWQIGQPNSYNGNQDCAEIVQDTSLGEWNDDGCFAEQIWICEN